jgi:hypothetical protein
MRHVGSGQLDGFAQTLQAPAFHDGSGQGMTHDFFGKARARDQLVKV